MKLLRMKFNAEKKSQRPQTFAIATMCVCVCVYRINPQRLHLVGSLLSDGQKLLWVGQSVNDRCRHNGTMCCCNLAKLYH